MGSFACTFALDPTRLVFIQRELTVTESSVLDLRDQAFQTFDKTVLGRARPSAKSEAEVSERVDKRLAIGYSVIGKKDFRLEVRVQRNSGPALAYAESLRETHGSEVNIVIVDVISTPPSINVASSANSILRKKHDVVRPGLSISRVDARAGTLGVLAEVEKGIGLLSAAHVIAQSGDSKDGDWIYHPGKPDQNPLSMKHRVARLWDAVELSSDELNRVDAAIALLEEEVEHAGNELPAIGSPVDGKRIKSAMSLDELVGLGSNPRVAKVGRSTGYTEGILTALDVQRLSVRAPRGNHNFAGVLEISWDGTTFSKPGDSGAALFSLDGLRAIGVHFASDEQKASYSCLLFEALKQFEATLVD
jgi:hypothetical protein